MNKCSEFSTGCIGLPQARDKKHSYDYMNSKMKIDNALDMWYRLSFCEHKQWIVYAQILICKEEEYDVFMNNWLFISPSSSGVSYM